MIKTVIDDINSDIYRYIKRNFFILDLLRALLFPGFQASLNYRVGKYLRECYIGKIPILKQIILIVTALSRKIINIFWGIDLPYTCSIGKGIKICHFSNIFFSASCIVGENLTIHQGVTIGKGGWLDSESKEPILGNNVFIGANSTILGNIQIGNNVNISANTCCSININNSSNVYNKKPEIKIQ